MRYNMVSASKRGTGKIRARTPPSAHRAPSVGGWEDQSDESTQLCFKKETLMPQSQSSENRGGDHLCFSRKCREVFIKLMLGPNLI